MRVYWTDRAKQRLKLIGEHIEQDSPHVAEQTIQRLLLRSRQIEALPRSGRQVPEYDNPALRELLERPYRIIYRLLPDRIDVVAVMHYRQILPKDMEDLG